MISKLADALKLTDLMKLLEYQWSGSLFDLRQRSRHFQTFSKTVELFETKYYVKASGSYGRKKLVQLGLVT